MQVQNMTTGCDYGPVNVSLPSLREQNATTFTSGAPAGFSSWSTFQFNGRISHRFVHLGPCWKENDGREDFPRYKIKSDLHLQLSLSQTAECESCILMRLWAQRRVAPPPPSSTLLHSPPLSSTLLHSPPPSSGFAPLCFFFSFFFSSWGAKKGMCSSSSSPVPALLQPRKRRESPSVASAGRLRSSCSLRLQRSF